MFQSVRYKIIVAMFAICLLPSELGAQATIENYNSVTDSRLIDPEDLLISLWDSANSTARRSITPTAFTSSAKRVPF